MRCSRLRSFRSGRRGGQCYYEQGSPFLSHASSRCATGCRPEVSHTRERVGSPKESGPPGTWTESGQTPILRKVSSSPLRRGGMLQSAGERERLRDADRRRSSRPAGVSGRCSAQGQRRHPEYGRDRNPENSGHVVESWRCHPRKRPWILAVLWATQPRQRPYVYRWAQRGIGRQPSPRTCDAHGVAEATQLVDQPDTQGVAGRPNAPAGDVFDLGHRAFPTAGHFGHEVVVDLVDGRCEPLALDVGEATPVGEHQRASTVRHRSRRQADAVEEIAYHELASEDPDRPSECRGQRDDDVGRAGDEIPTRCGQLAHRGHYRLARFAHPAYVAPYRLGGNGGASWRIDVENDRANLLVLCGGTQRRPHRVAPCQMFSWCAPAPPHHDASSNLDQGNVRDTSLREPRPAGRAPAIGEEWPAATTSDGCWPTATTTAPSGRATRPAPIASGRVRTGRWPGWPSSATRPETPP